jgi:hypothetical protein
MSRELEQMVGEILVRSVPEGDWVVMYEDSNGLHFLSGGHPTKAQLVRLLRAAAKHLEENDFDAEPMMATPNI